MSYTTLQRADTHEHSAQSDGVCTFKQVVVAVLQQTVDVQRDEKLGSEGVSVQVGRQCKRHLQNRDQQEAAGGCFSVPSLNLAEDGKLALINKDFYITLPDRIQNCISLFHHSDQYVSAGSRDLTLT